jgi:hypothetical protein
MHGIDEKHLADNSEISLSRFAIRNCFFNRSDAGNNDEVCIPTQTLSWNSFLADCEA